MCVLVVIERGCACRVDAAGPGGCDCQRARAAGGLVERGSAALRNADGQTPVFLAQQSHAAEEDPHRETQAAFLSDPGGGWKDSCARRKDRVRMDSLPLYLFVPVSFAWLLHLGSCSAPHLSSLSIFVPLVVRSNDDQTVKASGACEARRLYSSDAACVGCFPLFPAAVVCRQRLLIANTICSEPCAGVTWRRNRLTSQRCLILQANHVAFLLHVAGI